MKRAGLTVVLALALLVPASPRAYTRSTTSSTVAAGIAWDLANDDTYLATVEDGAVLYRLHAAGSSDVGGGLDALAVERAFRTWSGVSTSSLRFRRGPDTGNNTTLNDDEFTVFWSESSTTLDQGTSATEDDVSIAGALAVCFVYRATDGPESGEIRDASIVFNGADFAWTATPDLQPSRYDIETVALHEIGHALGLDHSPVAGASLFPRIAAGTAAGRRLSADDVAGITAIYPGGNAAASRGAITGTVAAGAPLLGAQVWALDPQGRLRGHAVTDAAGVYVMAGLPPGPLELHTQPVNAPGGFSLFSIANMGPYYGATSRAFGYSGGVAVEVPAGGVAMADLTPPAGTPALEIKLLNRAGSWSNIGVTLRRGESGILIGAAGPGLPTSGMPLTVSGDDVSVGATFFGTVAGLPSIQAEVTVAPDAALGLRDMVVSGPGGTTVAIGGIRLEPATSPEVPPAVADVTTTGHGQGLDLAWEPAPGAAWYRLYRGDLATLRLQGPAHEVLPDACFLAAPEASLAGELTAPAFTYYLVTAVGESEEEGSPGTDSSGQERPSVAAACP